MSQVHLSRRRASALAGLAALAVRARRTRPEPLPPAPLGSTTVVSDGVSLHAQVGGQPDAPLTVVLVHGLLARTIEFDQQWSHLSHRVRLVRYDHRHHGRSGTSSRPTDVATLAKDLAAVLDALAPDGPVVLVGHSMGGMTILSLAVSRPDLFHERITGVALIATGAGHDIAGHGWENLFRRLARQRVLAPQLLVLRLLSPGLELLRPRRTALMRRTTRALLFGSADADPTTVSMTQELVEGPPLSTLASLQGSLLRLDVRAGLAQLRHLPVLVLAGADDRLTRPEHSRRMAYDLGPSGHLVILPGAGHVVNQTRPDETNAALDGLLDRVMRRASGG